MVPTLSRSWPYFSVNNLYTGTDRPTDQKTVLYGIKNALCTIAGPNSWQVLASCDASSYNYGGADLWTGPAALKWADSGTSSWIVLGQPNLATNYQLLLSLRTNMPGTLRAAFSVNAGFTGGGTSSEPTATDQYLFKDGAWSETGCWWEGYYLYIFSCRWSVAMSADGQSTRVMIFSFPVTAGTYQRPPCANSFWLFDRVLNPCSAWTYPVVSMIHGAYDTSDHVTYSWMNGTARAYARIGSTNLPLFLSTEGWGSSPGPANLSYYHLPHEAYFSRVGLCSNTAPYRGHLGELQDIWYAPAAMKSGAHMPADTKELVDFGCFLLPWNGSQCLYDAWGG